MNAWATVLGKEKWAHIPGANDIWYIRIPRDDDSNHIADCWAYNAGDEDDDDDASLNNTYYGDGLTRYEEYRGVDINMDGTVSDAERLTPLHKDLFVQGSGFGGDFPDFAYGDAFVEAGIQVHEFAGTVGTDDRNIDVLVASAIDAGGHIYRCGDPTPSGVRDWTWSTKGQSTVGDGNSYGSPEINKYASDYYFDDKPHSDGMTWTAPGQWAGAANGVLDPVNPERVEDTNDNGVLDGNERDGATTPPTDDADNDFDGDYPVSAAPWDWNQELSPMDIDADEQVELPMYSQVPVSPGDEYTRPEVVQHTTTHEMGHAMGIDGPYNGHCNDPTCLMYRYSPNWARDGHLCNDCRAQIRIHNN